MSSGPRDTSRVSLSPSRRGLDIWTVVIVTMDWLLWSIRRCNYGPTNRGLWQLYLPHALTVVLIWASEATRTRTFGARTIEYSGVTLYLLCSGRYLSSVSVCDGSDRLERHEREPVIPQSPLLGYKLQALRVCYSTGYPILQRHYATGRFYRVHEILLHVVAEVLGCGVWDPGHSDPRLSSSKGSTE